MAAAASSSAVKISSECADGHARSLSDAIKTEVFLILTQSDVYQASIVNVGWKQRF
jgi:hypothetical protein